MSDRDAWTAVYALTPAGQDELRARSTSLSASEIELLVRIDGELTLHQIQAGMRLPEQDFADLIGELQARGLVAETSPDPFTLDFLQATQGMNAQTETVEVDAGLGSLRRKGYYVRIARRAAVPQHTGGSPVSLLVVEDDPTVRTFLQMLLSLQGFRVRAAGSRAEVVSQLNCRPAPDLVLLDVELPGVNGFDILARMKAHPLLCSVPVIMLTGADTREAVIRGIAGGADGYITKPADPDSVGRAVALVLGLPGPRQDENVWSVNPRDRKRR